MRILKIIVQWFIYSSKNPANLSLTLKGLTGLLVFFGIDAGLADEFIDSIVQWIINLGQLLMTLIALWGFARKIVLTFWNKDR